MKVMKGYFAIEVVLLALLTVSVDGVAASPSEVLKPPARAIPATFFGMHIHRAPVSTPWPSVPFQAWRLWDTHTTWAQLEPEKGNWDWRMLDRTVALAESHGVEVLYTMGRTPRWASARPAQMGRNPNAEPGGMAEPKNLEDWRNYVRTVATRYKGRIKAYEIWNEPNLENFYSGTPEAMVDLAPRATPQRMQAVEVIDLLASGSGAMRETSGAVVETLRLPETGTVPVPLGVPTGI